MMNPNRTPLLMRAFLPVSLVFVLFGCRTADLRPEAWRDGGPPADAVARGAEAWERSLEARGRAAAFTAQELSVTATDLWSSTFYRWFTPLERNDADLRAGFALIEGNENVIVTLLPEGKIVGVVGGNAFAGQGGARKGAALYAESLRVYTLLPFWRGEHVAYVGRDRWRGREFDVVWGSASAELSDEVDQYLFWIDPRNQNVVRIDFTYRDLWDSYQGTLAYYEYELDESIVFPRRIQILDSPDDAEFVHEIRLHTLEWLRAEEREEPGASHEG